MYTPGIELSVVLDVAESDNQPVSRSESPRRVGSLATAFCALFLLGGCYQGVKPTPAGFGDPDGTGIDLDPETSGAGDSGNGNGGDDEGEPEANAPPPQLRLLSAYEYENTIRDLLGIEFDNQVEWADAHTGFDNGGRAQLDESLLSLLVLQSEDVAQRYVEQHLALDHPCFSEPAPLASDCLEGFIETFAFRAYRRPPSAADQGTLLGFVGALQPETPSNPEIARWLLTRILVSPKFLYRVEGGRLDTDDPAVVDDYDRASLIAYTMTGSMPDALLFADATQGALDDAKTAEHVRRLAQTPRGQAQMLRFAAQWFRTTKLAEMRDVPADYPKLTTPELGASLAAEFDTFMEHTLLDGGTLSDLLLSTDYFTDVHTAPLYGLSPPAAVGMVPTPAPEGRMGVLGLASVFAAHASGALAYRDKPIARGLLIKNQLLCEEVGLPSGIDVNQAAAEVQDEVENYDAMTTREQLELIMNQDNACIACHQTFMPYGFLSSNYDALGQYQTHFGDRPLDSSVAELPLDGERRPYTGLADFVPALAHSDTLAQCYVKQVARFVSGSIEGELAQRLEEDFEGFSSDDAMLELFEHMLLHPAMYERNPSP